MKSFICPFLLKHGDCHVKLCVLFFQTFVLYMCKDRWTHACVTTRCERALYYHPSWLQLPSPRKQLWYTPPLLNQMSQKLELQSLRSTKKSCIVYLTHACFGCGMDVMDVSHPPLRPRGWTHGTLCVSRDCLGVSLEFLRSNEFTSQKFN